MNSDIKKYRDEINNWDKIAEIKVLRPEQIADISEETEAFAEEVLSRFQSMFVEMQGHSSQINLPSVQKSFCVDAAKIIAGTPKQPDKITVISARAGFGKTTFIYSFIDTLCKHIPRNDTTGLHLSGAIIVSDKLKSLREFERNIFNDNGFYNEKGEIPFVYILESWNKDSYTVGVCKNKSITSYHDNMCQPRYCNEYSLCKMSRQNEEQKKSPILLMTKSRYEKLGDSIEKFREWVDCSGNTQLREIVILDEKLNVYNPERKVSDKSFSELTTIVNSARPNDNRIEHEKNDLLNEIILVQGEIRTLITQMLDYRTCVCGKTKEQVFSSDFRRKWNRVVGNTGIELINDIETVFTYGALWCKRNMNHFKIFQTDSISNRGFKTFVFDATAQYDPDYNNAIIQFMSVDDYKDYEKLTFHIFKDKLMNMSQEALKGKDGKLKIKALTSWINNNFTEPTYIISYQSYVRLISQYLKHIGTIVLTDTDKDGGTEEVIPYFGKNRGSNDYNKAKNIIQIGWNRYDSDTYLAEYLSKRVSLEILLKKLESGKVTYERVANCLENRGGVFIHDNACNVYLFQKIAVELEQEIFRTSVREPLI